MAIRLAARHPPAHTLGRRAHETRPVGRTPVPTGPSDPTEDVPVAMALIEVSGQQLDVVEEGSGHPVVLLHAFPFNAHMWDYQIEALRGAHRVVAPSLPGFGASPPPADPTSLTMRDLAEMVTGLMDALEIPSATFVGLSMGGYLLMALADRHPERIARAVFADTRARSDDLNTWQRRTDMQNRLAAGEPLEEVAKGLLENLLSRDSLRREELVDYVKALMLASTPEGWIGALQAMKTRSDAMSTLKNLAVPALVVVGEQDRVTPLTDATLINSLLPDSRLVRISGAGHLPNLENPGEFDEALVGFLAETTPT